MKVIMIGLDGAGFELIDPWISEGRLPNIAKIKEYGVWADMQSVLPPVTSPNWKAYSTGKNPGKLGIFWWENIDWKNRRVYYPVSRKMANKEIWDYMGEAGLKVGVLGMPTTYPAKKVNGFLIAGGETGNTNFAFPPELEKELNDRGWQNHPKTRFEVDKEKRASEIHEIIHAIFNTASELGDRYEVDFLQATSFHINNLHHFRWDNPRTREAWEIIDSHIGKFMERGCDLMIMSDHGSNRIQQVFNINVWLQKEGYLIIKPNLSSFLYRIGITKESLLRFVAKIKLVWLARRLVPKKVIKEIPNVTGGVKKEAKTGKVNWEKSRAFASGQGPIYLNPNNHDNSSMRREIKQKLEGLVAPSTGDRIIEKVYEKEEIYSGEYMSEAPDLIMDQSKGVHIPGGIGTNKVFESPERWWAENKKHGVFMAYGPNIKEGHQIQNVSILDLAPTILHLMDLPVPNDMDGKALMEVFCDGSEPTKRRVKYQATTESENIKKKLGNLKKRTARS